MTAERMAPMDNRALNLVHLALGLGAGWAFAHGRAFSIGVENEGAFNLPGIIFLLVGLFFTFAVSSAITFCSEYEEGREGMSREIVRKAREGRHITMKSFIRMLPFMGIIYLMFLVFMLLEMGGFFWRIISKKMKGGNFDGKS